MDLIDDSENGANLPLSRRAMAARPKPYMEGLNAAQLAAVETLEGPVLMLAGAGTGKTRALTTRIAHLLTLGLARPGQVLAVTFTNKAAREMKNRIARLLGETVEGMPWLGTFHSISVKILRRHAELIGNGQLHLKPSFTILDTDDQIRLLKQLIQAENIDEKRWPARQLAHLIDGWKNRCLTPGNLPRGEGAAFDGYGAKLYAAYQDRLLTLNAVDFGDLLMHCVTLFQAHPDVLRQWQDRFRFILVDEYQDTNVAQYMWLRLLAQAHRNICCVGDDDQSIYGWRGAEVGNILRFEKDFPGAQVIRLEQNYRSTPEILAAASGLIAANQGRLGKTLWTDAPAGEKLRLIGHWDSEAEARWIGEEIEAFQGGHRAAIGRVSLNEMAILVRASHQMRAFEDRFMTIGLPYRVIGGPRFYERQEIRDAMAYFRLAVSPEDDLAFERVVNTPKRGLGDKAVKTIQGLAREHGLTLLDAARFAVEEKHLGGKGGANLREFTGLMTGAHLSVQAGGDHIQIAERLLDESGYTAMWQNDKSPDAPGRLDNLKELVKALEEFENLQGFLEHVSLVMDRDDGENTEEVSIMTLHAAKGLEFPVVFLPGWEEGLFPNQRAMDEQGNKGLEEERRLAYVGITRAERLATITFAGNRRLYGQWQSSMPSRFVDELPEEHVEVLTPPGLYGGGYGAAMAMAGGVQMQERAAKADVYNSPGWRRMQSRANERKAPVGRVPVTIDAAPATRFSVGDRVSHAKFGEGQIMGIAEDTLTIQFEAGFRTIKASYVQPLDGADDVPF
ncbi:UvrD-helicase domain-containing protein [Paracoccus sp. 1_MG-2023]|uniref:ATP-dependent helicase n=1 Tax=unclassified Paracoccus (in: a-proteobacteria) TaxID=2688777 RepID=UPI001C099270|nr:MULTISPECIES: UvrD-helicase domain-containing protein [unclassified Paracoccus (in: a-proteobacteria)]MBU2957500.1 UvrD-helicase domain-containing protein [Paracoccus sp. C2R09]MDO6670174.1 UvrD-helicase domain-containing protein [Paracoccus sp. 1_MG-2023]